MSKSVTAEHIAEFVTNLQRLVDAHHDATGYTRFGGVVQADTGGRKYVRITKATVFKDEEGRVVSVSGKHVFCFVDLSTGNVLKAASWKTPAKHPRGSIFGKTPDEWGVTPWGGAYLR